MNIRVINVSKEYSETNRKILAVDRVSLDINDGDFIAIVGPSGSGKTTLLSMIGGILKPTAGEIYWDKVKLSDANPDVITRIRAEKFGFVFQETALFEYMSVEDNLILPVVVCGGNVETKKKYIETLMKQLGLEHLRKRQPHHLSGGERRRVVIARALVNSPKILLADEPTGDLDYTSTREIYNIFKNLNSIGLTIVVVTHDFELARFARDVYLMKRGKIESRVDGKRK